MLDIVVPELPIWQYNFQQDYINNLSNIPPAIPIVAKPVPPLDLDSDLQRSITSEDITIRQEADDNSPLIEDTTILNEHLLNCQNKNLAFNKQRYPCNCYKNDSLRQNKNIEVNLSSFFVHKGSSNNEIDQPGSLTKKVIYPPLRSRY